MSRRQKLIELAQAAPQVLPSLLLCNFGDLRGEIARLEAANIRCLHLDVMDGNFVPNLTYGMPIVSGLRRATDMILDVHLMIERPERYFDQFFEAGADILTVHVEAVEEPTQALRRIRELGMAAGLALNPDTPLSAVTPHLGECDLVLAMSVQAGFGGQKFNPIALEKLRELKRNGPDHLVLEVDGGVNSSTIASCAEAGAALFVVGSAIFQQDDYAIAVNRLLSLLG